MSVDHHWLSAFSAEDGIIIGDRPFTANLNSMSYSSDQNVRYGYEVSGMLLLQILMYIYSIMRGVAKVVPLNSSTVCSVIPPLLGTFMGSFFQSSL
jgi:hypothetical protein